MMLPYSLHDDAALGDFVTEAETTVNTAFPSKRAAGEVHLILEKIEQPKIDLLVERRRITDFLERSARQFGANLISGRAATGKSCAAVDLARRYEHVAWYTVGPADTDWAVFARYFAKAIAPGFRLPEVDAEPSELHVSAFLTEVFAKAAKNVKRGEMLIVLDDIHHIFDAPWFPRFFNLVLVSTSPNIHLLFLCRSKPPVPLWRLRSKQVLNVVDEKMLAFDEDETAELAKRLGVPQRISHSVPTSIYGRAGKVADFLSSHRHDAFDTEPLETQTPLFLANTDPFVP